MTIDNTANTQNQTIFQEKINLYEIEQYCQAHRINPRKTVNFFSDRKWEKSWETYGDINTDYIKYMKNPKNSRKTMRKKEDDFLGFLCNQKKVGEKTIPVIYGFLKEKGYPNL